MGKNAHDTYSPPLRRAHDVGGLISEERRNRGLTQQDLAVHAGVTRLWLQRLETGKSTDPSLRRVMDVLNALGLVLVTREDAS